MKYTETTSLLAAAFAVAGASFAGAPAVRAQTQREMDRAAQRDADKADAAMNVAYRKLMVALEPAQKVQLKKSQRTWLVFRDADADLLSSQWTGGSGHPLVYENAIQQITEARTQELKRFLKEVQQESGGR